MDYFTKQNIVKVVIWAVLLILLVFLIVLFFILVRGAAGIDDNNDFSEDSGEGQYVCDSDFYNCQDFETYEEAKAAFDFCSESGDIHQLDQDSDGMPCESLL